MATRVDNDITLAHEDAAAIAKMLLDLATIYDTRAGASRSAPVRASCQRWATDARRQSEAITRQLWTWA